MRAADEYIALLQRHACHYTRNRADAEDAVLECLHAYRQRFGGYPWETTPDASHYPVSWCLCKLRALLCDHFRRAATRCEVDLEAADKAVPCSTTVRESDLLTRLMVEQFLEQLPPYLRRVAVMYEEGYSYKEIAAALGVALGTVQGYMARIVKLGREFFEVDGNKTAVRLVNMDRSPEVDFSNSVNEVNDGSLETTAVVDDERCSAPDCQHRSDAPHACRPFRNQRGG